MTSSYLLFRYTKATKSHWVVRAGRGITKSVTMYWYAIDSQAIWENLEYWCDWSSDFVEFTSLPVFFYAVVFKLRTNNAIIFYAMLNLVKRNPAISPLPTHGKKCSNHTLLYQLFDTLRLRQNGHYFPDNVFKWIFLNENVWISIKISLHFVPKGPIW